MVYEEWKPGDGITSACAEQTLVTANEVRAAPDHLRVCGADGARAIDVFSDGGSPPRVRSRRRFWCL